MITANEIIEFIDQHSRNLLIPRDGHSALMQIIAAAKQKVAQDEAEKARAEAGAAASTGGPG